MPKASEIVDDQIILPRILAYGPAKTRKTWWALSAAEAGFNVLLLDSDDGYHIIKQLPRSCLDRIHIVRLVDEPRKAVAAEFLTHFFKKDVIYWDNELRTNVGRFNLKDERTYSVIDPNKLTPDWVVVNDSWTRATDSIALRFCIEKNIDPSDAQKAEWEGYRWCGALATWMLTMMHSMNCHFITIGHELVYEKKGPMVDGKQTVEWTRTQTKSTSGNHSLTLAAHFSDILRFKPQGPIVKIDSRMQEGSDGGTRLTKPVNEKWENMSFKTFYQEAGIKIPKAPENNGVYLEATGEEIKAGFRAETEAAKARRESATLAQPTSGLKINLKKD